MKLLKITLLLLASSIALNAYAGGASPFYIGATVGVSNVDNDEDGIKKDLECDYDKYDYDKCSIDTDDKDTVGHIYGGFQFTEGLSIEAGYIDLGNTADYEYQGESITQETKGITLAGVARYRMGKASNASVYGKAGLVAWRSEVELEDDKGYKYDKDQDGVSPVVGVGVEYDLNHNITLRAGWDRYFDVGEEEHILSYDDHDKLEIDTLETDVDVFSAGVNYYFY